jgi:lysophospholipase L1-like esterase
LPGLIGLVRRVREKHPVTPIVLISAIYCPTREVVPSGPGHMTLAEMRVYVQEAVTLFQGYGDSNIYYIDGLKLLRRGQAHCLRDGLHPNAEGQAYLAANFIDAMRKIIPV